MWDLLKSARYLLSDLPQDIWPRLLLKSPVLRRLAMSEEVVSIYLQLRTNAPKLRERLAYALAAEKLITEDERLTMGIVPLVQRLGDHLRTVGKAQREEGES
jgi:hypothetical protein